MVKGKQKERTRANSNAARYPVLAENLVLALRSLDDGAKKIGCASGMFSNYARLVRTGLGTMEKYSRGELTDAGLERALRSFPKRFVRATAPAWFPSEHVGPLERYFEHIEVQRKGGANEILDWVRMRYSAPRGRPRSAQTYALGKTATALKASGRSWMQIAQSICPKHGPGHACSKRCQDLIRQAAKRFAVK